MDSRDRFSEASGRYAAHRPGFPGELIDWIVAEGALAPGARIADIGCGTGIATRLWAARGFDVIGVEPNQAMLAQARSAGDETYQEGEAADTGLPGGAFALVSAAQAFHYFELGPTLAEWRRLLAAGGSCATFWYRIAPSPIKSGFKDLRRRFGSQSGHYRTPKNAIVETLRARPEVSGLRSATFPYAQLLDRAGWHGRIFASSRMRHAGGEARLEAEIDSLFDRYSDGNRLRIPLEATAMVWGIV
ncbi:MAG: class I SAM-dependent methyltransferase [Akkermansiaceae bacterium]|nr:class I SAM-dependent methyltransferase [Akkermansiaceae bacterium]NNM30958.1 class I SAM-dependent methyltransferase [Akkermansiaceae bacterium]